MTWTLTEPLAYLFLPIGPKAIFVAVNDIETQRMVEKRNAIELVDGVNQLVAGRAVDFVYARDDSCLDFVRLHMGTRPMRRLIERLVAHRRAGPASVGQPSAGSSAGSAAWPGREFYNTDYGK